MNKKLYFMLLLIFILNAVGCEAKTIASEPAAKEPVVSEPVVEQIKATIPLDERKFLYDNGIKIEPTEFQTIDDNKIVNRINYPVISGLKDKSVQNKINNDILEVCKKLLSQFEPEFLTTKKDDIRKISSKNAYSYLCYSYNNVIIVEYSVSFDIEFKGNNYYPNNQSKSIGYDLNTGDKVNLDDVFKPGSDYKSKINSFISKYLIENNYDDYEAERMTKPFQGIRENQSFSLGFEGLRIILDEKNDEFFYNGYTDQIVIPFNYLGDDLYIFDKYYNQNNNIYEQSKLNKMLLPNKLQFKASNILQENKPKYYIYITQGEFINVPNKDIEKKLNQMAKFNFDLEGFKVQAKKYAESGKDSQYSHHVNIFINAGGYLSLAVIDDIRFDTLYEHKREPFNYDFNQNREMLISDIFADGYDASNVIKTYIKKNLHYKLTEDVLDASVKESIESNIFTFDEYAIQIHFDPRDANLEPHQKWVFIPFDEFGRQNIKLYN